MDWLRHLVSEKEREMKTILALAATVFAITGCHTKQSNTDQSQPSVLPMPEIIWLRQVHQYSDFADFTVEELPYSNESTRSQKSDFGINLTFGQPLNRNIHTVYFETASSRLSEKEKVKLDAMIRNIDANNVYLSGYADPRGSTDYNKRLSEARIASVTAYLQNHGLTVERKCVHGETKLPDYQLCEEGVNIYE